jgi:hypothetical protein
VRALHGVDAHPCFLPPTPVRLLSAVTISMGVCPPTVKRLIGGCAEPLRRPLPAVMVSGPSLDQSPGMGGRDQSERPVVIDRNSWSRSSRAPTWAPHLQPACWGTFGGCDANRRRVITKFFYLNFERDSAILSNRRIAFGESPLFQKI